MTDSKRLYDAPDVIKLAQYIIKNAVVEMTGPTDIVKSHIGDLTTYKLAKKRGNVFHCLHCGRYVTGENEIVHEDDCLFTVATRVLND